LIVANKGYIDLKKLCKIQSTDAIFEKSYLAAEEIKSYEILANDSHVLAME
jgi:hypothetical protein